MKIRIPNFMVQAWDAMGDWSNVPIWSNHYKDDDGYKYKSFIGKYRIEIRRIDVMLVIMGIGVVSYYWLTAGAQTAFMGGVMYMVVVALALFVF